MNKQESWTLRTTRNILSGKNTSRKDAIVAFCWGCIGYDHASREDCCGDKEPGCPLFPFRKGAGVKRELSDEIRKASAARLRNSNHQRSSKKS